MSSVSCPHPLNLWGPRQTRGCSHHLLGRRGRVWCDAGNTLGGNVIVAINDLLTTEEVQTLRALAAQAPWQDGRATAGFQAAQVKLNEQVPEDAPASQELARVVLSAINRSALFSAAALPTRATPPLFSRYDVGMHYGTHVDNAIRRVPSTGQFLRCDLSCTVFLSDPSDYDGGELVIEGTFGQQRIKLPAGSAILYPSTALHHVAPVSRGTRLASVVWIQSMVRDERVRRSLFEIDMAVGNLRGRLGDQDPTVLTLLGTYHNMLRLLADV